MALTDKQLLACFTINESLSDHNGRRCGRVHRENGVGESQVCQGNSTIAHGKVIVKDTCNEPCTFICEDANAFAKEVEKLKAYDSLIEKVKK